MDDVALRNLAEEMGLGPFFERDGFKESFRTNREAVEGLSETLRDRGRALPYPPLHWAARQGDLEMVDALLAAGADSNGYTYLEDDEDETPLVWLADTPGIKFGLKKKIALALIKADADIDAALVMAQDNDDHKFADFLELHGA